MWRVVCAVMFVITVDVAMLAFFLFYWELRKGNTMVASIELLAGLYDIAIAVDIFKNMIEERNKQK